MTELIFIRRAKTDIPFGFKLQGGSDFSIPLSVLQVSNLLIKNNFVFYMHAFFPFR